MTTIPSLMRAFVLHEHGDFDALRFHDDWRVPTIGAMDVLLRVKACGLNNTDVNTRTGWYSKSVTTATTGESYVGDQSGDGAWDGSLSFPLIQGGDIVGIVESIGSSVDKNLLGKRCLVDPVLRDWSSPMSYIDCGYVGSASDGGFADYVSIDHRNVHPIDCDWSDTELATIPISYSTAENLLDRVGVSSDDLVLITGASGGVGSALIQLSNRRGASTIALASESKHEFLSPLNPTLLLPRTPRDLPTQLRSKFGRDTVTVIIDVVGGDEFGNLLEVLCRGGRYGCSGAIAGPIVDLDLRTMYLNDLTFHGCTIFPPRVFASLVSYIESGDLVPLLSESYSLPDLHDAQRSFIEKSHVGNIVVSMD